MAAAFVDREGELASLEGRYGSGRLEFVVVYGRRRVGKTALILKFMEGKPGVYLLARQTSEAENLARFSLRMAEALGDRVLAKNPLRSWDAFFSYLSRLDGRRAVIALDEFQYLVEANPSLPSVMQEYLDGELAETDLFLIACGSSVGMMERISGYGSPLYGRRTGQILLRPLRFHQIGGFFPRYRWDDLVRVYGILGGTPAYLREFSDGLSPLGNLRERYLRPDSLLYMDAPFILREELPDPRNYFAIMEAVARGRTTLGEIISDTGLPRGTVGKYLSVLRDLGLVRREVPVTESWKSRRGRYRLSDPYLSFWFRFVHPNSDLIEAGRIDPVLEEVRAELDSYLGPIFEEVAREAVLEACRDLGLSPSRVGRWWGKRGEEVDLVVLDRRGRVALLVEVKWADLSGKEAAGILRNLRRKSEGLLEGYRKLYGLVARRLEAAVRGADLTLDLGDFDRIWGSKGDPAGRADRSVGRPDRLG